MDNYFNGNQPAVSNDVAIDFIRNVYTYMFAALGISGILAYLVGTNEEYFRFLFINQETGGYSIFFWVATFAPLAIVFAMSLGFERISTKLMLVLFIAYSALMGLSLSTIFMVYTDASIYTSFFISAGVFALMAVLGYTTKTDLTKFGSLLYMALIGVILASLVNMFVQSSGMDKMISYICVFVFTGLVAYKMQELKNLAHNVEMDPSLKMKMEIFGGLSLYITFVNLFLTILRLFGSRD
jgi:FtsH-binding integral membrane protein